MSKEIEFKEIEEKLKKFWKEENVYKTDFTKENIYSIDSPPPTVSGSMHMGHAFSYSQQDFIARFRRMFEGAVFYPFGTDDNGLPTERLIEKIEKVKSLEMSRENFISLCLKILKKETPKFIQDWVDLGISFDREIYYSTINDRTRKLSQKSFIEFYKKGFIYEKKFPAIWCSTCKTSIAQAELEDKEVETLFSTLKFECDSKELLIATTRPEFLPACRAIFVNPLDKRYKNLIGKKAKVPLFNFEVPIIADESADMKKGTGVLMICSYGDRFDVDSILKRKLTPKIILDKNGKFLVKGYEGLSVRKAREKILNELKEKNLIKEQKKINHILNVHERCETPIEFLPIRQWFVKLLENKKELLEQGRKINWFPIFMRQRYENWINGLGWDWNISRNRLFGVPIPVWKCENCNEIILAEEKELPVDPTKESKKCLKCGGDAIPEKMVFDTWFTSSSSPQIVSELSGKKIEPPLSLRPQAHDIIRTWAFYSIVKEFYHSGKIPWKNIIISGNVFLKGEKMSKSKGNVIDPQEILKKYGADALRFWASSSKLGTDTNYQEKDLIAGKKLIKKLVNASKFIFMNLEDYKFERPKNLEIIDEEFLIKLNELIISVTNDFNNYEYSQAKLKLTNFFWEDFTSNYLEIVKKRIYEGNGDKKLSAQWTLYKSLLVVLKLFAPIMPFITEEIYLNKFKEHEKIKSIHLSEWPKKFENIKDKNIWNSFLNILLKVRSKKSELKKSMNSKIILTIEERDYKKLNNSLEDLKNVTNSVEIKIGDFGVEFL